jgi:hypothetical protein
MSFVAIYPEIFSAFDEIGLVDFSEITKCQLSNMIDVVVCLADKGTSAKMVDFAALTGKHRTTYGSFFSSSTWKDELADCLHKNYIIRKIKEYAISNKAEIFYLIDDSISIKTLPSSSALCPIEKTTFHFSHTIRKSVLGHQCVFISIVCGDIKLIYDIILYDKDQESKISIASKFIDKASDFEGCIVNVLADSWYTCDEVINSCKARGFIYTGALKCNRKLTFKDGYSKKLNVYALDELDINDSDVVTVNGQKYHAIRANCSIKGVSDVAVIMCWPEGHFGDDKLIHAFTSTNQSLDTIEILNKYTIRWNIEVLIKAAKSLGFDEYMVRKIKAIKRIWLMIRLAITIFVCCISKINCLGDGIQTVRQLYFNKFPQYDYEKLKKYKEQTQLALDENVNIQDQII